MNAVWSAQQQRILAALGCTLYRPAAAPPVARVDAIDAFTAAVLRAAGCDPGEDRDVGAWWTAHGLPSLATLRADPSAKRALWPRLRALRRGGP